MSESKSAHIPPEPLPTTLFGRWKHDVLSGFLVFLIALPLCLAISINNGFPAVAGLYTAIIGGILVSFISNSELTIKGPAAGLIPIVAGCVDDFARTVGPDHAVRMTLAVCVVAGLIQIVIALCKGGALAEFFPTSVVHGMLASIGIIIIAKQVPKALGILTWADGTKLPKEPLELLADIPKLFSQMNPQIALIGISSVSFLFLLSMIKVKWVRKIPAPLVVLVLSIGLGLWLNLREPHTYTFAGTEYQTSAKHLVNVGSGISSAFALPEWEALKYGIAWKWIALLAIIASLESLLSAKAVDLLDPWHRKTNFNRDLLGCGVGNALAGAIGGSPMIAEIVRSRANIDNGARSRWSNVFHGMFLLLFVWLAPTIIAMIPEAALAGMLIFTGYRLAHPKEFLHVFQIGREQFFIYCATILGVLAIDLLVGVAIGIALKFIIHLANGMSPQSLFKAWIQVEEIGPETYAIRVSRSATFSNWIAFRNEISNLGLRGHKNLVIDLSGTTLVDHTVMEKLHEMQREFGEQGLTFDIIGLEEHKPLSSHPMAARKRRHVNRLPPEFVNREGEMERRRD
jgi:MFS superfamily sulfate permease-like transporter